MQPSKLRQPPSLELSELLFKLRFAFQFISIKTLRISTGLPLYFSLRISAGGEL